MAAPGVPDPPEEARGVVDLGLGGSANWRESGGSPRFVLSCPPPPWIGGERISQHLEFGHPFGPRTGRPAAL